MSVFKTDFRYMIPFRRERQPTMSPRVFPSWFPVLVLILAWSKYASIVQCAGKLPLTDVFRRILAELGTAHGAAD
jgi:hypothetical protein